MKSLGNGISKKRSFRCNDELYDKFIKYLKEDGFEFSGYIRKQMELFIKEFEEYKSIKYKL